MSNGYLIILALLGATALAYGIKRTVGAVLVHRRNVRIGRRLDELFGPRSLPRTPYGRHRRDGTGRHDIRPYLFEEDRLVLCGKRRLRHPARE